VKPLGLMLCWLLLLGRAGAASVDSLWVPGASEGEATFVLVIVPDREEPPEEGWPVVYLLHGYGADPRAMLEVADLPAAADRYGMAIVCPDGRPDSWYFDSPLDSTVRVETVLMHGVVPQVEARYGFRHDRSGRAIVGVSMGGHGALYLAVRHPERFGAAASISGVLDLTETTQPEALARRLGSFERYTGRWRGMSVLALADSVDPGDVRISIDCGLQDPFLAGNRRVHQKLLLRGVSHVYTERPGGHDRQTFAHALRQQLLFCGEFFGTAR